MLLKLIVNTTLTTKMATLMMLVEADAEQVLRRERVFRDRTRQLDTLADGELVSRYRMPRHALIELVQRLEPLLTPDTKRSHALTVENKVLITLRFLSKGAFFTELADLHGAVKSSVCRVLHPTVRAINTTLNNINFDLDNLTLRRHKQDFFDIAGFPRVIGAIDGTLIPIKKPPVEEEAAYVCRKGYHAINVQAICDPKLRFLNVVVKWPGSSHDASILTNSQIGGLFETDNPDGFLLGDSGYGCRPWLLTPFPNPTGRPQERYNSAHCRTRNVIERAFGVLKSRFRCLHKSAGTLPFGTQKCCHVIMAAFKLHNFCVDRRLAMPEPLEETPDIFVYNGGVQDGTQTRLDLIQNYFS